MPHAFKRTDRIAEMIKRKLVQIIQKEIKDPRLPVFLTVSDVQVAKDLSHSKIFFTVLNGEPLVVTDLLNTAASYLRTALARTLTIRTVPKLHFIYDHSIEQGMRLSRLIDDANPPENADDIT